MKKLKENISINQNGKIIQNKYISLHAILILIKKLLNKSQDFL